MTGSLYVPPTILLMHPFLRVTKLENLLREKDRVIEEMTVEKRNLEKIKRDQEKQLDIIKNERDYMTKVRSINCVLFCSSSTT